MSNINGSQEGCTTEVIRDKNMMRDLELRQNGLDPNRKYVKKVEQKGSEYTVRLQGSNSKFFTTGGVPRYIRAENVAEMFNKLGESLLVGRSKGTRVEFRLIKRTPYANLVLPTHPNDLCDQRRLAVEGMKSAEFLDDLKLSAYFVSDELEEVE